MHYECDACGAMSRFWQESTPFTNYCPECGEETLWVQAFEGQGGVTF